MTKHEIQNKSKFQIPNDKTFVLIFAIVILNLFCALNFVICYYAFAQDELIEANINFAADTKPLPEVFKPSIDLSGRGLQPINIWPEDLAAEKAIESWSKDIGFSKGLYRIQYDLWEIHQLAKDKKAQDQLLANYEKVIKAISDSSGTVILDIFGTPAGLGKVLDKNSAPWNLKAFKEFIKPHIKYLSCDKKYNIQYEVWSAPDLEGFFLGSRQDYFNIYKAVAQVIMELEAETKIHIPIGGPSVSWWFQSPEGNTIISPERSLIYGLIKFCNNAHLPLDFISWHSYSSCPDIEQENTTYRKDPVSLIREWLTYFNFNKNTPLIIDEWNYDNGANMLLERQEKSNIAASYIISRLKNMADSGIDRQIYFCLEDFNNRKDNVIRNVGIFWYDPEFSEYKGGAKPVYNVFRMLNMLNSQRLAITYKPKNEFIGAIATKASDSLVILVYNYIDPNIARDYLSKNIAILNEPARRIILNVIKNGSWNKLLNKDINISALNLKNKKVEALLKKALELSDYAASFREKPVNMKLNISGLANYYSYQKYVIDDSCSMNCPFTSTEEKDIEITDTYQEILTVKPYSVNMFVFKVKPRPPKEEPVEKIAPDASLLTVPVDQQSKTTPR